MSDHREIATAPGDLPADEIMRRHQTVHRQFRHENTTSPLAPRPGDEVSVEARAGVAAAIDRAEIRYTTDGSLPGDESDSVAMHFDGADWCPFAGGVGRWVGHIPAQREGTVVRYRIDGFTVAGRRLPAQDGQGFWYRYPPETGVTVFAYRVRGGPVSPPWLAEAVIYQIFVDRFRRRSGAFRNPSDMQAKHGGDLAGIIDALPYLEELGVNCIWLSPVGPAPSYHRYDSTDHFAVDPILGDLDTFRALTAAAHERAMRVILDFVPSHLSVKHPAFAAAQAFPDAETRDWFTFYRWPHEYRSFLDLVPSLVSLNTNSEGVREFLLRSARFWVECGVDGFRLDHVIGHGMDFWVEFQNALEEIDPSIVTIGEATDTGDALKRYRGRINSILDFPLARALRLTFATRQWDLAAFDNFLLLYEDYMDGGPDRVSFLDNHDMDRFLFVAGQDAESLKLAALALFTLRPTPVLYYATEIGATHTIPTSDRERGGDALARQDMEWVPDRWDRDLLAFFRCLVAVRREHLEAVQGRRRPIALAPEEQTYAYELSPHAGGAEIVVAFNLSAARREIALGSPTEMLIATRQDVESNRGSVILPPRSGAALRYRR